MIFGILKLGLYLIGKWDKPLLLRRNQWCWIFAGAAAEFACVAGLTAGKSPGQMLLWAVVGGCLLLACVTDCLLSQVYNFTWWLSLTAAVALLWCRCTELTGRGDLFLHTLYALLFFGALQLFLFRYTYGRADCYAFCVCAAAEGSLGGSAAVFLVICWSPMCFCLWYSFFGKISIKKEI